MTRMQIAIIVLALAQLAMPIMMAFAPLPEGMAPDALKRAKESQIYLRRFFWRGLIAVPVGFLIVLPIAFAFSWMVRP